MVLVSEIQPDKHFSISPWLSLTKYKFWHDNVYLLLLLDSPLQDIQAGVPSVLTTKLKNIYLDVDLFPKDSSAEVFAAQLFPPGACLNDPCSDTPLLTGAGPSLKDRGGLALAATLDGGPSWITIEPRPLLY